MITATFAITLDGIFFANATYLRWENGTKFATGVRFPKTFPLSVNEKHYSNEKDVLKHLNDVILPYIDAERKRLGVGKEQAALVLMGVF